MSCRWQRANGMTTAAGEERIRQFIAARREEIRDIEVKINKEMSQITTCNQAISNLDQVIPDGRKILKAHEENLVALKSVQGRLSNIPSISSWKLEAESTSKTLCTELKDCVTMPAAHNSELVKEQVESATKEIRTLWEKMCQLEMELEGWKFSLRISTAALGRLKASKAAVETDISSASDAFSPIRRTSTDIWAKIFGLVLRAEFEDYIKANDTKTLRPMVHVLSHVCNYWRSTVLSEPSLWWLVYASPVTAWKQDEYDLLTKAIQKSTKPLTLLIKADQVFNSGYYPGQRYERNGGIAPSVTVNETLFKENGYELHIDMFHDHPTYMQRLANLPFSQPSSIVYSSTNPICYGYLFSYLTFNTARSLKIINETPSALPSITLSSQFPQLTTLIFRVKQFPHNFYLVNYLTATLEELHIQTMVSGTSWQVPPGAQLPKLRTLGVTSATLVLLSNLTMPELRTLILYGSSNPNEIVGVPVHNNLDQACRRITHVEFQEWGRATGSVVNVGAAWLFGMIVPKMPGLHSIRFIDSWVDGKKLAPAFTTAMGNTGSRKPKYLEEITLSGVEGITRNECDRIRKVVPKLNVYV